jgi:hypothetical protein
MAHHERRAGWLSSVSPDAGQRPESGVSGKEPGLRSAGFAPSWLRRLHRFLSHAFDFVQINANQFMRLAQPDDFVPMPLKKRKKIAHLHVANMEVNHFRWWIAQQYPVGKIRVLGYDG